MKPEHFLILYTCIKSKWIEDLSVRLETVKHLEENISSMLFDICLSDNFSLYPQGRSAKGKINKWDLIKLRSFCLAKEMVNKKTAYRLGENLCKQCDQRKLNF